MRFKFKAIGEWKWISNRLNNGDWDYWLVMELVDMAEACGDTEGGKYLLTINAVSPAAAGEEKLKRAIESCYYGEDIVLDDPMKAEALNDYGVYSTVWSKLGNNARALLKEAREQAWCIEGLFGFYMDGPKDALGHTGWDFIRGDLSLETAENNRKSWEMSNA